MNICRILFGLSLALWCLLGCSNPSQTNESSSADSKKPSNQELLRSIEDAERRAAATTPPKPAIVFPEVDDWIHTEPRPLPPESHGFTVAYEHPCGVAVTLYQFTRGHREIPDDLDGELIKDEMNRAKTGIEQAVQVGLWSSAKESDSGIVRLGKSTKQALWTRHILTVEDREMESDTYIWSYNNTMFKIRCTGRPPKNKVETEALTQLLTAIGNTCNSEPQ